MTALFIVLITGFASAQFPVRPTEYTQVALEATLIRH
jgi:hypothetical protein